MTTIKEPAPVSDVRKALYATADLLEARIRRLDWWPNQDASSVVHREGFNAAFGVTTRAEWFVKDRALALTDRRERRAWMDAGGAVFYALVDLLVPEGQHSPSVSPASLRTMADQLPDTD